RLERRIVNISTWAHKVASRVAPTADVICQIRTPPPGADATAIERFFEDEACALARAIAATGHAGDSVAQEECDRLFRTETATTWSVGRLVAVLTSGCAADRPQWPPRDPCTARRGSGRCAAGS